MPPKLLAGLTAISACALLAAAAEAFVHRPARQLAARPLRTAFVARGAQAETQAVQPGGAAHVVVVGGGIVGLTAAFFLIRHGARVTLVEKCRIACHSSGKGGGFLAHGDSGWHDPESPLAALAKHSFALHKELANIFGADRIEYRGVRCLGLEPDQEKVGIHEVPRWLDPAFCQTLGDQDRLAQVTPHKLMRALQDEVCAAGCEVRVAKVVGVGLHGDAVESVSLERDGSRSSVPCDAMVMAMGPWASEAAEWFPDRGLPTRTVSKRYTSVVWNDTSVGKDATLVFTQQYARTEIYPRPSECYANGCPARAPLPDDPDSILPDEGEVEQVRREACAAVSLLSDAEVVRTGACFLPGSDDGDPVVGLVPGVRNAVLACGGGSWGLLNGPAMGQSAALLALSESPEVDVSAFDPSRFAREAVQV